jgi:hypothetical protein
LRASKLRPEALHFVCQFFDRLAPRARSAAVRQNARPSGRGQGELYEDVCFPYRARKPAKRTPALQGGEASQFVQERY